LRDSYRCLILGGALDGYGTWQCYAGLVSTEPVSPKASVLEALAVFAIIMAYIWKLRFTHPRFWFPVVALILISHVVHRERARALGFRATDFGNCVRRFGPALIGLALAMLTAGLLLGTIRPIGFAQALGSFTLYLPWGLFQQYLLNGYFLNRFDMMLSRNAASILTSVLFCAVHSPNWFLMVVTPVAGYGAVWVYRRYKNLYFLGLAHAMIGFLLFVVVPDSISHHLNVGPRWSGDLISLQSR
jgi:membrane protease YdiL (CAAX protease family)